MLQMLNSISKPVMPHYKLQLIEFHNKFAQLLEICWPLGNMVI